jgi:hypothetical protein
VFWLRIVRGKSVDLAVNLRFLNSFSIITTHSILSVKPNDYIFVFSYLMDFVISETFISSEVSEIVTVLNCYSS